MTLSEVVVRPVGEGDREAIGSFACSTGRWYEDEVQQCVRAQALEDARRVDGYELLVAEQDERLIACMAYTPEGLEYEEHHMILAMRLQVLAITTADQGRVLARGRRLSDALMPSTYRRPTSEPRNGFVSQIAHSVEYVRMFGRFGTGPFSPE